VLWGSWRLLPDAAAAQAERGFSWDEISLFDFHDAWREGKSISLEHGFSTEREGKHFPGARFFMEDEISMERGFSWD